MASIINPETFAASETQPEHGFWIEGSVEVTLRGLTRRVSAKMYTDSKRYITARGFTGRYETGSKAWPATVTRVIDPSNNEPWDRIQFGRDEKKGRCRKVLSQVWFQD